MHILLANLRHLYQRRHLWPVYLCFAAMWWLGSLGDTSRGDFAWTCSLAVAAGFLTGMMIREMISKAFTHSLPGHPTAVRRMAFLMGFVISSVAALAFPRQVAVHPWDSICLIGLVFSADFIAYLTAFEATFVVRGGSTLMTIPVLAAWSVMITGWILAGYSQLELLILDHPLLTILGSIMAGLGVWLHMGQREWGRQLCASGWVFSPSVQREGYARLARRPPGVERIESTVEAFFLNRMRASAHYHCARFVWGTLYTMWGHVAPSWKWLALAIIFAGIMAGYAGPGAIAVFMWFSYMALPQSWPSLRSPLLLPAGRRERFWATISFTGATAAIMSVLIILLAAISMPLSVLIPEIEIQGVPFAYHRISIQSVWAPLLIVPVITALRVPFRKRWLPVDVFIVMMVPLLFPVIIMLMIWLSPFALLNLSSRGLPTGWLPVTLVVMWGGSLTVCRYVARHQSLIGP